MNKAPAFQWYPSDWLSDTQLRLANPATKGIWIDLLCYMWELPEQGKITVRANDLIKLTGATPDELSIFVKQAQQLQFCDLDVVNGSGKPVNNFDPCDTQHYNVMDNNYLYIICNRRMHKAWKDRKANNIRVARHRDKVRCNATGNAKGIPLSSSSSSSSTDSKENKDPDLYFFKDFPIIKISVDEFTRLVQKFGQQGTMKRVENLYNYIQSSGKRYKSHYHTILTWENMDGKGKHEKPTTNQSIHRGMCGNCRETLAVRDYTIDYGDGKTHTGWLCEDCVNRAKKKGMRIVPT